MKIEIIVRNPDTNIRQFHELIYTGATPKQMDKFWKKLNETVRVLKDK